MATRAAPSLVVFLVALFHLQQSHSFVHYSGVGSALPLALRTRSCSNGLGGLRMGQEFKGFGKEVQKKQPASQSSSDPPQPPEPGAREEPSKPRPISDFDYAEQPFRPNVPADPARQAAVPRGRRAEPVNVDGKAMLDTDWISTSVKTVLSDEWRQAGRAGAPAGGADRPAACPACGAAGDSAEFAACGGTGRIQGGIGTLPGMDWWPIKAFRPCPAYEKAGLTYDRRGQALDEVLFGKTDMPPDYKRPDTGRGLTADDVKRIMNKTSPPPAAGDGGRKDDSAGGGGGGK